MKKILLPIIGLLIAGGLLACNETTSTVPSTSTVETPTTIDMNKEMTYSVQVLLPDGTPFNNPSTVAQWCDGDLCFLPKALNAEGKAETSLMPKTYGLHLLNLPEQYTYDVNAYNPTFENPHVIIQLYEFKSFEEVEENGPYNTNQLKEEGAYKINIKSAKHMPYYSFLPSRPGVFVIESYTDDLGPIFIDYGSNPQYVEAYHAQANSGGTGKNFKYEWEVSSTQIQKDESGKYIPYSGVTFIFAFMLKGQTSYPTTFDIVIRWDRKVEEITTSTTMVQPKETLTQFSAPAGRSLYKCALNGTVDAIYNETDGFYHLGSVNGPVIVAKLTKVIDEYDFSDAISEFVNEAGNGAYTFVVDETETEIIRKDYTDFVAKYAEVCNEDGVYPVTQELKEFLFLLAYKGGYFMTGGFIDQLLDFQVLQANYWLFACYYYDAQCDLPVYGEGNEEVPFVVTTGTYNAYYEVNQDVYYVFAGDAGSYKIYCADPNAKLIIGNNEYSSENGFEETFTLVERGSYSFRISTVNNQKSDILFTIEMC